jgi:hypothetical protein
LGRKRRLRRYALGATATAGGLRGGDTAAFALGDEVAALLDLSENSIALDGLAEARQQMLPTLTVSKVY